MKNQKRAMQTLTVLCSLLLLSGCGGKKAENTEETAGRTEKTTEAAGEAAGETQTEAESSAPEEAAGEVTADRPAVETERFTDGTSASEDAVFYQIKYDTLVLTGESRTRFSALNETLEKEAADRKTRMDTAFEELKDAAAEMESYGDLGMGVSISDTLSVRRCDSRVLSVLETDDEFLGGAHGSVAYVGLNYDVQTGEKLELTDLVRDTEALLKILADKLCAEYPDIMFFAEDEEENKGLSREEALLAYLQEYYKEYPDSFSFTVDHKGLTFYFSQYAIAAYAYGMQEVEIGFLEEPSIFTGRCTEAEGAWAMNFENNELVYYTENGKHYSLSVQPEWAEYDEYHAIDFYINDALALRQEDIIALDIKPLLIETEDGRHYLWLRISEYDDYNYLLCYAISGDTITSCGSAVPGDITSEDYEQGVYMVNQLCDPARFAYEQGTDLLGTYSIYRYDRLGRDGLPEGLTPYYFCRPWSTLTTKQELTLEVIEDNAVEPEIGADAQGYSEYLTIEERDATETTGGREITLPAGTKLTQYRTNGINYVDCRVNDSETVVRVQITFPEGNWEQYVNGMSIDDVFDGVAFAG